MTDVWVLIRLHRVDVEDALWEREVHSVQSTIELGKEQVPGSLRLTGSHDEDGSGFFATNSMIAGRDQQVCYQLELFTVDE